MPPKPESRQRFQNDMSDPRHGTWNGYQNLRCRCDDCKLAAKQYQAGSWTLRRAQGLPDPDDPRHGTYNGYNNRGCRCRPCKDANRDRQRKVRGQAVEQLRREYPAFRNDGGNHE